MKKYLLAVILLFFVLIVRPSHVKAAILVYDGIAHDYNVAPLHLIVNNVEVTNLPVAPIIISDYTYVPAREMFESIGAVVNWDGKTSSVFITYENHSVTLQINNKNIIVNGNVFEIPIAPKIVNDKTMIPIRFAAEPLGFTVEWEPEGRKVILTNTKANHDNLPPVIEAPDQPPATDKTETNTESQEEKYDESTQTIVEINNGSSPETLDLSVDVSPPLPADKILPETKISKIILPASGSSHTFTIVANSAISSINKFLLKDNRLIIDIYNAEMALPGKIYTIEDNAYIQNIRVGQFQLTPEKITRVVFDITTSVNFSVTLSEDRKIITITFEKNKIKDILFTTDATKDYITIAGDTAPVVTLFPLQNPNRLVIDLPLSTINPILDQFVDGLFTDGIRSGQFEEEISRIVIDLKNESSFSVSTSGNKTVITLSDPTYKNIDYSSSKMMLAVPKNGMSINIKDIVEEDRYDIYKYSFTLPGDYSSLLGYGEMIVKDSYINSIFVENINGKTKITFNENQILAFAVTEDENNIYFNAMPPKEKYSRIVVLDPGHGGSAPGTSGYGMIERDVNLDMSLKLIALLEADPSIKVYSTRKTDVNPSFDDRVALGNNFGDLFVSLHNNAAVSASANGTEVFYHDHQISAKYSISSKTVASIFQKNLLADLGLYDRKYKADNYYVIKNSTIPAILVEVGFLSNESDAKKIATQAFRQKTAESLYRSIKEVFENYKPPR